MKVGDIYRVMERLKQNRDRYLKNRPVRSIVESLDRVSKKWLRPDYRFRKLAEAKLIAESGFDERSVRRGIDRLFRELSSQKMLALLGQELGSPKVLDHFVSSGRLRQNRAVGPPLITHVFSGNVFSPAIISLVLGLLIKSANLAKCSSQERWMPTLFWQSLKETDRRLASCLHVLHWKGGKADWERRVFGHSDAVVAYGSEESLSRIGPLVPRRSVFIGYGHRVSFAMMAKSALEKRRLREWIKKAVVDIRMYNQMGCLSPQVIFVEKGGAVSAVEVAEKLQKELSRWPMAERIPIDILLKIRNLQHRYDVRRIRDRRIKVFGDDPRQGIVFYDDGGAIRESPLRDSSIYGQAVVVKGFSRWREVAEFLSPYRPYLQALGVAASGRDYRKISALAGEAGFNRVCPLGRMQEPPLRWHHDGMKNLIPLLRWVDCEQ